MGRRTSGGSRLWPPSTAPRYPFRRKLWRGEGEDMAIEELKPASGGEWIDELEIGALGAADAGAALDVLSRGRRDNPLHVAVVGEEPEVRRRRIRRVFEGAYDAMGWQTNMLVARDADGTIVGLCGAMPPGGCQMGL